MSDEQHPVRANVGPGISERQAQVIDALSSSVAFKGKSSWTILRELPTGRRWGYFRDQLLARTLTAAAIAMVAVFLVVQFLTPKAPPKLYVAAVGEAIAVQDAATLQREVATALRLPEGRQGGVRIDAYFDLKKDGLSKLQAMLSAQEIDVIIANPQDFRTLAGYGYMTDLTDTLTAEQVSDYRRNLVRCPGFDDADHEDPEYNGAGKGATAPFGFQLATAGNWTKLPNASGTAMLGLAQESRNLATARRFVTFLEQ
ncbi:hypothetical protein H7U32_04220 [Bifidobacterium pullorum subsp. saeculare]|uniref:Uncharacterized protein n=1 Tax=Bifidobacterium pullorum subsp. saeculare TaxID=78257 RepID=A0A938WVH1_9BIFI|nr:hypothetical protein [Bifidobacterium pullorum]MBM6699535.1 hypothetical protein [Bifidobacterium pullorum subsp. saeculare]